LNNTAFLGSLFFSILSTCFLFIIHYTSILSIFCCKSRGGVTVTMLAIGPKFSEFEPSWGDGFLRAIKIRSMTSSGGELKPSAPIRNILRHVKNHCKVLTKIFQRSFPLLISFHHSSPCSGITWWMNTRPASSRRS
jgi:hypothetical protein